MTPNRVFARLRPTVATLPATALLFAGILGGCTRPYYRNQADTQVGQLWREFTAETNQPPIPPTINIRPQSRLFDPLNPDHPPMPPDDPVAHTRMHYVDGKRGYRKWHDYGETPSVDNQLWRMYLPYDERGAVVLDLDGAVQTAYLHSRTYQRELEDLYFSALDVTFERFRFDAQFFGTNDTLLTTDGRLRPGSGGQSRTILSNDSSLEVHKLYAGGGQLIADLANSIVWQFSGPNTNVNTTVLDVGLVQPLLRFGGRARVLEQLTLAERTLLYNVRQMEQFRQGFYTQVVFGRDTGEGPSLRGLGAGVGNPLSNFNGIGGYFGLLQSQLVISNLEANVSTLRDSLRRLQDEFDANRIQDKFQVELARQALYEAQSRLLAQKADYQTDLDTFKIVLGLPPSLEVKIDDPLLAGFVLIDPNITRLSEEAGEILLKAHHPEVPVTDQDLALLVDPQTGIRAQVERHLESVEADFAELLQNVPQREAQLQMLAQLRESGDQYSDVDPDAYSVEAFRERVRLLRRDIDGLRTGLGETWSSLESLRGDLPKITSEQARERLKIVHPELSSQMLALVLSKARARVDAVTWVPVNLTSEEATETARLNRRDWMNARASLVDSWRLIEYQANLLRSGLDVVINGDISTVGDNPVKFRGEAGRLQMGLRFDAPLTRLVERNDYRQTLIDYQRNRRNYMLFEDRVNQNLRSILRTLDLNQVNFEIRRSAVQVAIQQVDLARENLNRPPRINETAAQYAAARASIGRDLVSALGSLLSTQNDFIAVWLNYEVQRRNLDFEMGTMQLDERGIWMDPGPIVIDRSVAGGVQPLDEDVPIPFDAIVPGIPLPAPPPNENLPEPPEDD